MACPFEYEAFKIDIGTRAAVDAERPRRVAAASAFSRWIFVSDHAGDTASSAPFFPELSVGALPTKTTLVGKVFFSVCTSVVASEVLDSVYI